MKAPRRGVPSPPRLELSGSEPSHEPQPRSVKSSEKSTPRQQAAEKRRITAAATPKVFAEGLREEFSADASDGALLQPGVPAEGAAVVAMEKPATLAQSENGRKKRQQQSVRHRERLKRAERASSGLESGARGSSQAAAVKDFFRIRVIVPAATNASSEPGARHCSASARMTVAAR